MAAPETAGRPTDCLVWERTGTNRYGRAVFNTTPRKLTVRWNTRRSVSRDRDGRDVVYDGDVVLPCAIEDGSLLWRGCQSEYDSTATDNVYYELVSVGETLDVRGRVSMRTAKVQRYAGSLPAPNEEDS